MAARYVNDSRLKAQQTSNIGAESRFSQSSSARQATLYRMVMDKHVCPYGLKARHLLKRSGFEVDDQWLESREATDDFKERHEVETTPQIFIGDERIGGYDDLRRFLGKPVKTEKETSYQPVAAIFAMAFLMALAISWVAEGTPFGGRWVEWFVASAMTLLALQKLQDVGSFSTMFLNYDLLARRVVPYGYVYPFAEGLAGLLMIAGILPWLSAPIALFIGTIGAISVFKAVYIDRRELNCACVGGNSKVPLGFVSLTENLLMIGMGAWVAVKTMF